MPSEPLAIVTEMLEQVPFGLALYDAADEDFRIVYANGAAGDFMETPLDASIGLPLGVAFPSALTNGTVETMKAVRSTGESRHFREVTLPSAGRTPVRTWNYDFYPIASTAGEVTHVLGVGNEVTELATARVRIQEAANLGLGLLLEISRHAEAEGAIEEFFGRVCETVAGLLRAERVAFFMHRPVTQTLDLQLDPYGVDAELASRLQRIPCRRSDSDLASRIMFEDHVLQEAVGTLEGDPAVDPYREWNALAARNVLAIAWRAGDERLGVFAAFDTEQPGGFSDEDLLLLRTAGRTTGLVFQRWRAEQELAARAQELESLERSKSNFLNLASHELRGPLTVVRGYLSLLREGAVNIETPGVADTMETKLRDIESMVSLMLDAARLEESTLELKKEAADLREVVAEAVGSSRPLARPGQRLVLEAPDSAVAVVVDRNRIATVVSNLITNAYKYSHAPSVITCTVFEEA
ncbi:MAG: histidine kinase dimerization/phospho-acceptor domain-containing protein, partial [Chloroflexota bacterium]